MRTLLVTATSAVQAVSVGRNGLNAKSATTSYGSTYATCVNNGRNMKNNNTVAVVGAAAGVFVALAVAAVAVNVVGSCLPDKNRVIGLRSRLHFE